MTDSLEEIKAVLAKAVTDSGQGDKFPKPTGGESVTFVELFEGHDKAQQYRSMYKESGIRYGDLKAELAEAIYKELQPIQEKENILRSTPKKWTKYWLMAKNMRKNRPGNSGGSQTEDGTGLIFKIILWTGLKIFFQFIFV